MAEDIKKYVDEEILKSDLRLAAESERIQRIVSESRLNFYIKLFSALGAIIVIGLPLTVSFILSSQNRAEFDRLGQRVEQQSTHVSQTFDEKGRVLEQRLDSAISSMNLEMRRSVNDFSRNQTKPPRFSAVVNGKPLDGLSLDFTPSFYSSTIALTNIGEGTARSIGLTLYCADSTYFDNLQFSYGNGAWQRLQFVDEKSYKAQYKFQYPQNIVLSPQEPFPIDITVNPESSSINTKVMLKVTYEQGSPRKFVFKVTFKK